MQNVDRPAHVQALSQPARHRRPRVNTKALRVVPRTERLDGIGRHRRRRRAFGQDPAVRPSEAKLAVGLSLQIVALFVDCAVVPTTEEGEVR